MKVWIVELTEPLPFEPGGRTMRCGQLARYLVGAGHEVVWWTSSFSHLQKRFRCHEAQTVDTAPNYQVEMLHGPGYKQNVSLARLRSQAVRAREFRKTARNRPRPDIILSAMPTLEVSEAVVEYGLETGVPVVVDIRDKWPDAFVPLFPRHLRPFIRLALLGEFRRIAKICQSATAIFAVSDEYIDWGLRYAGRCRSKMDDVFLLGYDPDLSGRGGEANDLLDELRILPQDFVVCFIGQFGATYDLATVIEAARRAHAAGDRRICFVLAGDGPRAERWKALAADLPNVRFTGWLTTEKISALLHRANVGLAAYAEEAPQSLPNKVFEYFAGGMPVLSSLRGELEVLLSSYGVGYTYRAGDAAQLLTFVRTLEECPDQTNEMAKRARKLAETEFSSTTIIRRMAAKLHEIARAPIRSGSAGRGCVTAVPVPKSCWHLHQ